MKLRDWMKENGVPDEAVADHVGKSKRMVRKWKYGEATPRAPELVKIEELTDSAVTARDFVSAPRSPDGATA